jgi:hypothetical protein
LTFFLAVFALADLIASIDHCRSLHLESSEMPEVLGFNVSVVMEGKALAEYGTQYGEDEAGRAIVSCYIPSEADKVPYFSMARLYSDYFIDIRDQHYRASFTSRRELGILPGLRWAQNLWKDLVQE